MGIKVHNIAIRVRDMIYAGALAAGLVSCRRGFNIMLVSSADGESAGFENYDLLLSDPDMAGDFPVERTIILTEPLRYAGASAISSEIYGRISKQSPGFGNVSAADLAVYVFAGVEGGAGTSSLAIGAARELSRYRSRKCLYISMEYAESELLGIPADGAYTMADLIYEYMSGRLRGNSPDLQSNMISAIRQDEYGVMRFMTGSALNHLLELDISERTEFISTAVRASGAECLILDQGCALTPGIVEIPRNACIIAMSAEGSKSLGDASRGYELASALCDDADQSVLVINRNKFYDNQIELQVEPPKQEKNPRIRQVPCPALEIDEDPSSFEMSEGRVNIMLSGAFGTGIKKIVDIILCEDTVVSDNEQADADEPSV